MKTYKLLTPGPLTTTDTVKQEMLFDHCTWDDDYKKITQEIRAGLLKLAHVSEQDYNCGSDAGQRNFWRRVCSDQRNRSGGQTAHLRQRSVRGENGGYRGTCRYLIPAVFGTL